MANELFNVDTAQLEALAKFYKRAPKIFAKASGSMLNEFAFGTRVESFYEIASKMTIRNAGFVSSRLQVTKSAKTLPISHQMSIMGSVAIAAGKTKKGKSHGGFSGWTEQQFGTHTNRTRTVSLLARLGNAGRQMTPASRMKPSNNFLGYEDFRIKQGSNPALQTIIMMQMMSRGKYRKPFLISRKNASGMTPGLYIFRGGKPRILQSFYEPSQPHRIPWITNARNRFFADHSIDRLWVKTLGYALKGERVGR
jgi:hypothetical protein